MRGLSLVPWLEQLRRRLFTPWRYVPSGFCVNDPSLCSGYSPNEQFKTTSTYYLTVSVAQEYGSGRAEACGLGILLGCGQGVRQGVVTAKAPPSWLLARGISTFWHGLEYPHSEVSPDWRSEGRGAALRLEAAIFGHFCYKLLVTQNTPGGVWEGTAQHVHVRKQGSLGAIVRWLPHCG